MSAEKIVIEVDSDSEDLILGFLANRKKDLEKLQDALDNKNFETLQSIGHSLKGVGGGYGFDGLSEMGASIEKLAKSSDLDNISLQLPKLKDYSERVEIVFK